MNQNRQNLTMAGICICILAFCYLSHASADGLQLGGITLPALCAFKLITNVDCPGCGITRAFTMALHGQIYHSYLMHIGGIPLLIVLSLQIPYRLSLVLFGPAIAFKMPAAIRRWVSLFVFLSLLLPWITKSIVIFVIRYL